MTADISAIADHQPRTFDELLGESVHQALWRRRIKQTEFAEQVLGISQSALSLKMRGKRPFFAGELAVIATSLGVSVDELLPEMKMHPDDGGDDDGGASGAPTRARTWDLRINRSHVDAEVAEIRPIRKIIPIPADLPAVEPAAA